jgi:hypothetical protein
MDALPIHELNEIEYRSQADGKMHACGYDGHTSRSLHATCLLTSIQKSSASCVQTLVITHIFWAFATKRLIRLLASSDICKAEPYQSVCKAPPELMGNHQSDRIDIKSG